MNKKGFTLVELLATIVILGVLSTIGIASTSKYLTQSRKKSYRIMSQTVYEAAMNCITQGKCNAPTSAYGTVSISTAQLIDYGYLKKLDNPRRGKEDCSGTVTITNKNSNNSEYKKYEYSVKLICQDLANNTLVWPNEKSNQTNLDDIRISS